MIDTIRIYTTEKADLWKTEKPTSYGYVQRTIENMIITETYNGTTIEGSLARFLLGNNYDMDISQIQPALEKLEALTGLDLHKAILRRVDYAETVIVKNPCCDYLKLFRGYPRKKTGVYYADDWTLETVDYFTRTGGRGFCIYDKNKETKDTGGECPSIYSSCNVLRLEIRLENQTGVKAAFCNELISPWQLKEIPTYNHLKKLFWDFYKGIAKDGRQVFINLRGDNVTSRDVLLLLAESFRQSNPDLYYQTLDRLQGLGVLTSKERGRLREKENQNKENVNISDSNPLIAELDGLVWESLKLPIEEY